ncbi:diguanylate cyclase [Sulfurimonas sp. HSL3-7]|uniref:GGDEF domain-containing protein n=1 Tax=Sulfonitrofixus jiaomeiensis TaxID=3131938 RepID=UPI0031F8964D
MRISIIKIFAMLKSFFLVLLFLAILLTAAILSEYSSFYKLENLQKEKELATTIYTLGRDDLDLSIIQYRGQSSMLKHEQASLLDLYAYDFIGQFVQSGNYHNEVAKLDNAVKNFNKSAEQWYTQELLSDEELQVRQSDLTRKHDLLIAQINSIISQNMLYEKKRFYIQQALILALLGLILYIFFSMFRRLTQAQGDINALFTLENVEEKKFQSIEADAIAKRISRNTKPSTTQNPAYLDAVTGINNHKGLIHEFSEKKSQKIGNYTAICIFAIDRLNEIELQYSQDFLEAVLKKVGFMLSLYRQHNDVIGRLDHNQFAIILSRQSKAAAFGDCELIRKSVEDTPFKTSDGQNLAITLSGGFVQKLSTQSLEEVITKANKVLGMSIQHGGNRIAQLRDKSTSLK